MAAPTAGLKNPKLRATIDAIGGPTTAAYKCKTSVSTVYTWERHGYVYQAQHVARLLEAARDAKFVVTVDELAFPPTATAAA